MVSEAGSELTSEGASEDAPRGLFGTLWHSKCWRLYPLVFLCVASVTIVWPLYPGYLLNFFASRHAHSPIHCEDYMLEPKVCQQAHADVVTWQSVSDFLLNAVILFILAPMIGRWSDLLGRRPFLLLTFLFAALPFIAIALHIEFSISLWYYFPARAMNGIQPLLSLCNAMAADLTPPRQRAPAFGLILGAVGLGMLAGPILGGTMQPSLATWVASAMLLSCVLWAFFVIPESLSKADQDKAVIKHKAESSIRSLKILVRSSMFVKLTAVLMLLAFTNGGFNTLYAQFFEAQLRFTAADQALVFIVAGISGLIGQTVVLQLLIWLAGEARLVAIGCLGNAAAYLLLAVAPNRLVALIAVYLTSIGDLAQPGIGSIMSRHVHHHEQGAIQGAIAGANSLAQGVGPLLFAALYNAFSHPSSHIPYFLGAPFVVSSVLLGGSFLVAASVNAKHADSSMRVAGAEDEETNLVESLLEGASGAESQLP